MGEGSKINVGGDVYVTRQCGLAVLRVFVTGAPPNCGGLGMLQRIIAGAQPRRDGRWARADRDRRRGAAADLA